MWAKCQGLALKNQKIYSLGPIGGPKVADFTSTSTGNRFGDASYAMVLGSELLPGIPTLKRFVGIIE
jgi:hypothetical protein